MMDETHGPLVRFTAVSKRLGGELILDHLDLELPDRQVTVILGPSGAGKTTLLRHINALVRPDDGTIEVFGQPIDDSAVNALRKRIGYAVQAVGLFPHLTAAQNIELAARLAGWTAERIARRRARLAELMRLPDKLMQRYPHELSGGQQRRVGLCRAMMLEPELLLLDEPFTGVDPDTRRAIHTEFSALLRAEPAAVVMVSHDVQEALALGDRVVVLDGGQVIAQGAPAEVLAGQPGLPTGRPVE